MRCPSERTQDQPLQRIQQLSLAQHATVARSVIARFPLVSLMNIGGIAVWIAHILMTMRNICQHEQQTTSSCLRLQMRHPRDLQRLRARRIRQDQPLEPQQTRQRLHHDQEDPTLPSERRIWQKGTSRRSSKRNVDSGWAQMGVYIFVRYVADFEHMVHMALCDIS